MDFFKSVFVADPPGEGEVPNSQAQAHENSDVDTAGTAASTTTWRFGGLMKSLASRSESVFQNYTRDIEEFGSGLRKEASTFRDVANRVVRDLPTSLESGASAAQESLENVGQIIDDLGDTVWRGTAGIISQGKDALQAIDPDAEGAADQQNPGSAKRLSRLELQIMGMQRDQATFLENPEVEEDYRKWKEGFRLSDEEIDDLCADNAVLRLMFNRLVPRSVDYDAFWSRYFYKTFKLKQAEDARAKLVKRVIAREEDEEDLSWEVEDDEQEKREEKGGVKQKEVVAPASEGEGAVAENKVSESSVGDVAGATTTSTSREPDKEETTSHVGTVVGEKPVTAGGPVQTVVPPSNLKEGVEVDPKPTKVDHKKAKVLDGKATDPAGSCKDGDASSVVVSSQPSKQVEDDDDLEWDEIGDLGENDVKKPAASTVDVNKDDLRKRLSVAGDDEDLSWDIEDN